jgi:hypothetical protein
MEQPTTAALQQIARDVFGRELSLDEVEAYRGRLSVMVDAIRILQAWEPQLRHTEPAAVHSTPRSAGHSPHVWLPATSLQWKSQRWS